MSSTSPIAPALIHMPNALEALNLACDLNTDVVFKLIAELDQEGRREIIRILVSVDEGGRRSPRVKDILHRAWCVNNLHDAAGGIREHIMAKV